MPQKVSKIQNHKILVGYWGQNLYSAVAGLLEKFHVEHKLVSFPTPSYYISNVSIMLHTKYFSLIIKILIHKDQVWKLKIYFNKSMSMIAV